MSRAGTERSHARWLVAATVLVVAQVGCVTRAPIPDPVTPLTATARSALVGPPEQPLEEPPFTLPLVSRRLDNGFTIVSSPGQPSGIVSVVFVSRAWSPFDARSRPGVTALAASSMFRRTRLADGGEGTDLLSAAGFSPEVELLDDGLRVSDRIAAEELPRYAALLARSLRAPHYRDEDQHVQLGAQRERLVAHRLTVDGQLEDRLPAMLYAEGDPRARNIGHQLEVLEGVSARTFRDRHRALLDPSACAVIITGDVEAERAIELFAPLFADLAQSDDHVDVPRVRHRPDGPRGLAILEPLIRSYVLLRERAPPVGHRDHAAFRVLEQLLGGMFGAHLNLTLREEHTASYGFHASYRAGQQAGELELSTALDPRQTRNAVELIVRELRRVRGDGEAGLEARELTLAKTRARALLTAELDTSLGLAKELGLRVLGGLDPSTLPALLDRIEALTAEEVEAAARRWLRPERAPMAIVASNGVVASVLGAGVGEWEQLRAPQRERR